MRKTQERRGFCRAVPQAAEKAGGFFDSLK